MKAESMNEGSEFLSHILTNNHIFDLYKRWIVRTGPIRATWELVLRIWFWEQVELTLLFILVWVCALMYPFEFLPIVIISFCVSCPVGLIHTDACISNWQNVKLNLEFNEKAMLTWCEFYDSQCRKSSFIPTFTSTKMFILSTCFLVLAYIPFYVVLFLPIAGIAFNFPYSTREPLVVAFENQRWWLGNWSDKGLTIGTQHVFPWSDETGFKAASKPVCDEMWTHGEWMYSTNFAGQFHNNHTPSDFVRKRMWTRRAKPI